MAVRRYIAGYHFDLRIFGDSRPLSSHSVLGGVSSLPTQSVIPEAERLRLFYSGDKIIRADGLLGFRSPGLPRAQA